jgi:hypothetical protein
VVLPALRQHAKDEWQGMQNGAPVLRAQATDQRIACAEGYRVYPVVRTKCQEWNLRARRETAPG